MLEEYTNLTNRIVGAPFRKSWTEGLNLVSVPSETLLCGIY